MFISEMGVYSLLMLDTVKTSLIGIGISGYIGFALLFLAALLFICYDINPNGKIEKTKQNMKKCFKYAAIFLSFSILTNFIGILLPTSKQYVVIKSVPMVINSKFMQDLPENISSMFSNSTSTQ